MTTALADNPKAWKTRQERPISLEIILLKRAYVLPWSQFLYAEGGDDEVHMAFATHDVSLKGSGLQSLLADVACQRVAQLEEPARPDRMENAGGACIREISVIKCEDERS